MIKRWPNWDLTVNSNSTYYQWISYDHETQLFYYVLLDVFAPMYVGERSAYTITAYYRSVSAHYRHIIYKDKPISLDFALTKCEDIRETFVTRMAASLL